MSAATTVPQPLVPAEVDLSDFKFMPLDCVRLRDSDLTSKVTGDEFRCAVLLWCASWHQQPAASLPDDDEVLSKLAGFGRVVKEWLKVKAGAMRGWVRCSDDRFYHPVVAEKALEAWRSKLEQRWKTECSRIKKHMQRNSMALHAPDFEEWVSLGCPQGQPLPVPGDIGHMSQGHTPPVPRETPSKGQGRDTDREGNKEKTSLLSQAPARPSAEQLPAPPQLSLVDGQSKASGVPDCPHLGVLKLWAEVLPSLPQHLPSQWRGTRADHLRARWRETAAEKGWTTTDDGIEYLRKFFAYVGRSPFLTGRAPPLPGKRPFVIELEWLVNPTNWAKVHEGKYHAEAAA